MRLLPLEQVCGPKGPKYPNHRALGTKKDIEIMLFEAKNLVCGTWTLWMGLLYSAVFIGFEIGVDGFADQLRPCLGSLL